jgi:hypothetical protein
MSEPRFAVTEAQLVALVAITCAHVIEQEREGPRADEHLEATNRLLAEIGVTDLTAFNEEAGVALDVLLRTNLGSPVKTVPRCPDCGELMRRVGRSRASEGSKPFSLFQCLARECQNYSSYNRAGEEIH